MSFYQEVLLIFLSLLAVSAVGYFAWSAWRRKAYERAWDPEDPAPYREPPRLGRVLPYCLLLCCLLSFQLWAIHLQQRVEELEAGLNNSIQELSDTLDNNYLAVRAEMERKTEYFRSVAWEPVELDPDNALLTIRVTAEPKRYSEDTWITVSAGDQELSLERQEGGLFAGTMVLDLRSEWNGSIWLNYLQDDTPKGQMLDFSMNALRGSLLPYVSCSVSCRTENGQTLALEGEIQAYGRRWGVRSMTMELTREGRVLYTRELPVDEKTATVDESFSLELPEPLPEGELMVLRLSFLDELGLRHEMEALAIVGGEPMGYADWVSDTDGRSFYWVDAVSNAAGEQIFWINDAAG